MLQNRKRLKHNPKGRSKTKKSKPQRVISLLLMLFMLFETVDVVVLYTPASNIAQGAYLSLTPDPALSDELYMQSPQVVFIGDSLIAGYPANSSFIETDAAADTASSIGDQFGDLTGYTFQNMGISGQTTDQIAARFNHDVVDLHPRAAVLEGGVNDINNGVIMKTTFLDNWTSMLDACQSNDIIPIVIPIMPWTNGTAGQMNTRDDWNASLIALSGSYDDALIADTSSAVGRFRAGGAAGNLWDIKAAYDADGIHMNSAGYGAVAQVLADVLQLPPAATSTFLLASGDYTSTFFGSSQADFANLPATIIQLAVSTTPDFKDASWEDVGGRDSILQSYGDANKLYIKFRNQNGGVSEVFIYERNVSGGNAGNDSQILLNDGDIVKTPDNPDVYIIKYMSGKKYKRLILSPSVFRSYQHLKWENIKIVTDEQLNRYTTSALVQAAGDKFIYELTAMGDEGERRLLESGRAYDPDSVYEINYIDGDSYILAK